MTTLHEQARAEAEKRYPNAPRAESWANLRAQNAYVDGFLAGHEAATADDDARITRLVGVVTATTMLGPQDAETVVRALVAHAATRTRVVSTVAELDALPDGTVMRARNEALREMGTLRDGTRVVWAEGWSLLDDAVKYDAPFTVLHEPEETP